MSEFAKLSEPMLVGRKNPGGRSLCARSSMPLLAEPASSQPGVNATRGSTSARAAAGMRTARTTATASVVGIRKPLRRRRRIPPELLMSPPSSPGPGCRIGGSADRLLIAWRIKTFFEDCSAIQQEQQVEQQQVLPLFAAPQRSESARYSSSQGAA